MNHLVEIAGKTHKISLPDTLVDGQPFVLTIDGTPRTALWLRREGQLVFLDQGREETWRIRSKTLQRDDGEAEVKVDLEVRANAALGILGAALVVKPDVPGQGQRVKANGDGSAVVKSPITGKVLKVLVKAGDLVDQGTPLAIIEAMKMENRIFAPSAGKVQSVAVKDGDPVQTGKELVRLSPAGGA